MNTSLNPNLPLPISFLSKSLALGVSVWIVVTFSIIAGELNAQNTLPTLPHSGVITVPAKPVRTLPGKGTHLITLESGTKYAGRIDYEGSERLIMTRRNGRIAFIDLEDIDKRKMVENGFSPQTSHQLRVKLQKEFGSKYEVSLTKHFVVVHPPGDYQKWAVPFEELYERFKNYFRSRGMILDEPEFPMVAIVLRTRKEFDRMVAKKKGFGFSVVGYYAYHSNRLIAYQQDHRYRDAEDDWIETMATIVHEAVHQTAANTGVHSRLFPNPLWTVEGLATMFEAKGINNYFKYSDYNSRINFDQLKILKKAYENGAMKGTVRDLIASDNLFRSGNAALAYSSSWGLSFYLSQQEPTRYVQYLEKLQDDKETASVGSANRIKYFEQTFGPIKRIEGAMERFIKGLPDSP